MARDIFYLVLLAGCLVATAPLSASAQDSSASDDKQDEPTALTVGRLSTNFTYDGGEGGVSGYNYDLNTLSLMVSGSNGSLLLDYSSNLSAGSFDRDTRRTIGAEAFFGGNAYLFREFLRLPLDIYIPIRIDLDYRYVQPQNPELSNLHRGAAGLGAGGGAQFQFPIGPDFIKDNLLVRGTAVLAPAVGTSLGSDSGGDAAGGDDLPVEASRTRMRRTFDINLEALFTKLLGKSAGVSVGYTFRTYNRSQEKPSSVGDVIDAATLSGNYQQTNVQHMIRVGLSW